MDVATLLGKLHNNDPGAIGRTISLVEDQHDLAAGILQGLDRKRIDKAIVIGITGPPGVGKSTLTGKLVKQLRLRKYRVGIVAIDPSSSISGGALLGDRVRMMEHAMDKDVFIRSMATRGRLGGICSAAGAAVRIMAAGGYPFIIIETVGVGQSEMDIVQLADITTLILAPGFGDDIQAMKAGILEVADLLVINKVDLAGANSLLSDLNQIFEGDKDRERKLFQTNSKDGSGIEKLLERILALEVEYRQNGILSHRRRRSLELESIDWAMELLRPSIRERIRKQEVDSEEPRLIAEKIVRELVTGDNP